MKLGICGTGQISEQLMRNVSKIKGIHVVSVMHREIEKAIVFANEYHLLAFGKMSSFLSSDIDTVYIGLPNSLHYETAKQCICANKHVLIEKPVTSNLDELNRLIELAEKNHVILLEVNRVVYLPNVVWAKQQLTQMGNISSVSISYCKRSRKYDDYLEGKRPNVFTSEYSGGALMDLGVYGLHLACELFGYPQTINYDCQKLDTGVDAEGTLTLNYGDWNAEIHLSKITNGLSCVSVYGEQSNLLFEYPPSILKQGVFQNGFKTECSSLHEHDNFYYFLKNACDIIDLQDKKESYRLMQKSIQIMTLMDEARKQSKIVFSADLEVHP